MVEKGGLCLGVLGYPKIWFTRKVHLPEHLGAKVRNQAQSVRNLSKVVLLLGPLLSWTRPSEISADLGSFWAHFLPGTRGTRYPRDP
ncbi:MAG: hypothetical protein COA44_15670 [Arcobacter sp.]|nr:MAG: hypothetical protein COA44_15670 [Arcobacter sp.]